MCTRNDANSHILTTGGMCVSKILTERREGRKEERLLVGGRRGVRPCAVLYSSRGRSSLWLARRRRLCQVAPRLTNPHTSHGNPSAGGGTKDERGVRVDSTHSSSSPLPASPSPARYHAAPIPTQETDQKRRERTLPASLPCTTP
jgi:hypothetical protein